MESADLLARRLGKEECPRCRYYEQAARQVLRWLERGGDEELDRAVSLLRQVLGDEGRGR